MPKINANLANRVKHLPLPKSGRDKLMPIFEAVSNSYHAIGDLADRRKKRANALKLKLSFHWTIRVLLVFRIAA